MNKLESYIYLTICEVVLEEYKKTNFTTFTSFCFSLGYSLSHNNLSSREKTCIIKIVDLLDILYSMDTETTGLYISEFFDLEPSILQRYQLCIMDTKKYFPEAFN